MNTLWKILGLGFIVGVLLVLMSRMDAIFNWVNSSLS
jgi:hypothetical protein